MLNRNQAESTANGASRCSAATSCRRGILDGGVRRGDDVQTVSGGPTVSERMLRARELELFVRERGEGRPLLLINGLGGNVDMWTAAEDRFSAFARTITFDSPGCGRSPALRGPVTIPRLARTVSTALDELGYEQVDVLGFSLGGLIAQQLAHDDRRRVRRLALVATACGWGSMPGSAAALALVSMPLRYHSRLLYEQTRWLLAPADRELLERATGLSDSRLKYPPSVVGYMAQLWAGALWSSLHWLRSVDVPTLVVHGDGDRLVPHANAVQLARHLPVSRLHLLPDEGHLLVFDTESASLPRLADFFASASLDESHAWTTGTFVDDDDAVESAFADAQGMEPYRTMSGLFRRAVQHFTPAA
jgi:poly(3-hydroxyoctanoate) depolymerase